MLVFVKSAVRYYGHTQQMFLSILKQEPYMEGVNPFIKNNKHRMIMFLDELGVSCTFFALDQIVRSLWVIFHRVDRRIETNTSVGTGLYFPWQSSKGLNLSLSLCLQNVPDLPEATEHFRTDLSRDLAALHEVCITHSDELRTLSNERGAQQVRG